MNRVCFVMIIVCAVAAAVPAGAVECHLVATFQACNGYCSLFGATCSQMEYDHDPFASSCSYRYHCSNGHSTGWGECTCGGPVGCLVPGTQINLENGTTRSVEQIQVGDRVQSYIEATGALGTDQVTAVHDPVDWTYHLVINGELRITPSHSVLSKGSWVEAAEIRPGDPLTRADGTAVLVETLEVVTEPMTVHNFATDPNATYVASGYIVHNKPPIPKEEPPDGGEQ